MSIESPSRRRGSYVPEQVHQERWGLLVPTLLALVALAALGWFALRLL